MMPIATPMARSAIHRLPARALVAGAFLSLAAAGRADTAFHITPELIDAGTLVGAHVEDPSGALTGPVRGLVVGKDGGRLVAALVGRRDALRSIPWKSLRLDDGTVRLDADARPGPATPLPPGARRLHEIIGMAVHARSGDRDLGNLERVIATKDGRLVYGILEFGGVLGIGNEVALVPWHAFELDATRNDLRIETDERTLRAAAVQESDLPKLTALDSARRIHKLFDQRPYWEELGSADVVPHPDDGATTLSDLYDPSREITVSTFIVGVGTYYPERGPALVRLRLEQGDHPRVAYVAPWWYCQDRDIRFVVGDPIKITGAPAEVGKRKVLLARVVEVGGRPLHVREDDGKPGWGEDPRAGTR